MNQQAYIQLILNEPLLISYWKLDDLTGTTAFDFQSFNNGIYNDGSILNQPGNGIIGPSVNAVITILDSLSLQSYINGVTAEIWVQSKLPADNAQHLFFVKNYEININNHILQCYNGVESFDTLKIIDDGNWHHVVITFGNPTTYYLDGVKVGFNTDTPNLINVGVNLILGNTNLNIMHAALYNGILTSNDILAHYTLGTVPITSVIPIVIPGHPLYINIIDTLNLIDFIGINGSHILDNIILNENFYCILLEAGYTTYYNLILSEPSIQFYCPMNETSGLIMIDYSLHVIGYYNSGAIEGFGGDYWLGRPGNGILTVNAIDGRLLTNAIDCSSVWFNSDRSAYGYVPAPNNYPYGISIEIWLKTSLWEDPFYQFVMMSNNAFGFYLDAYGLVTVATGVPDVYLTATSVPLWDQNWHHVVVTALPINQITYIVIVECLQLEEVLQCNTFFIEIHDYLPLSDYFTPESLTNFLINVYVDGVNTFSTISFCILSPIAEFEIGNSKFHEFTLGFGFTGYLMNAALYTSALSQAQVSAHFTVGSSSVVWIPPTPIAPIITAIPYYNLILSEYALISFWQLNEFGGTIAYDAFDHNNGIYNGIEGVGGDYKLGQLGNGIIGPSVLMTGDISNYINIASSINFKNLIDVTLEIWICTSSETSESNSMYIMGTLVPNSGFALELTIDGNISVWYGSNWVTSSDVALIDAKWHHVVATISNTGVINVYVDSVNILTATVTPTLSNYSDFYIGNNRNTYNGFAGYLMNAALYNSVLTQAKITAHYLIGSGIIDDGLIDNNLTVGFSDLPFAL
jgi:hypothetical protein